MGKMPDWLEPMAATLTQERFSGPEWIFERKLDGVRLLAYKRGRDVQLFSRNQLPQNDAYPSVAVRSRSCPVRSVILDGEATGVWGRPGKVAYYVFDVMWIDERRHRAAAGGAQAPCSRIFHSRIHSHRVPKLTEPEPWVRACREGWEGVIAKRLGSRYEHRRSPHWLKMKCEASQELVVGGFTDPQGRRVGLGALLVGYFDEDDFVFAGKIGTGFDTKLLLDLRKRLDALEIPTTPFTRAKGLPRLRAHWVRPEIVVQAAFIEWTGHGKLRHPRLLGIRTDKAPRDVVREQP